MSKTELQKRWAKVFRELDKLLSVYRQILMDEINGIVGSNKEEK